MLSIVLATVLCLGGMMYAADQAATDTPAKTKQARRTREAPSPEKQLARLEASQSRIEQMAQQVEQRAATLESAEAKAQAKEMRELCAAAQAELKDQIQTAKQGQPITDRSRKFYGMQNRLRGGMRLLDLYAQKETAQKMAQSRADDPQAGAAAERIVQLCDKLIANRRSIAKLEAEQAELRDQLSQTRRDMPRGKPAAEEGKRGKRERKGKARKSAE